MATHVLRRNKIRILAGLFALMSSHKCSCSLCRSIVCLDCSVSTPFCLIGFRCGCPHSPVHRRRRATPRPPLPPTPVALPVAVHLIATVAATPPLPPPQHYGHDHTRSPTPYRYHHLHCPSQMLGLSTVSLLTSFIFTEPLKSTVLFFLAPVCLPCIDIVPKVHFTSLVHYTPIAPRPQHLVVEGLLFTILLFAVLCCDATWCVVCP
jgi:hypothetical protein